MPEVIPQEGSFKLQKRKPAMKKLNNEAKVTKIDTKAPTTKIEIDAIQKPITDESLLGSKGPEVGLQEVVKGDEVPEIITNKVEEEVSSIIEIPAEEIAAQTQTLSVEVAKAITEEKSTGKPLPENIEKLVSFMEETGGSVEDYVRLSTDYSSISQEALLREYYRKSRPHLDNSEIQFLMEDNFEYDEEMDEERDIRKKKLAFKEEVAKARNFLEETKNKYYDEIKLRPSVNKDQQKVTDFFNRYNEDQQAAEVRHESFKQNTKQLFTNEFKGFDFNLGEKNFRYSVANPEATADKQSNITNLIKKFLNDNGDVVDVKGYHKAMYAAENADSIAKHFYEQGKADAVKDLVAKSNNISQEPRQNMGQINVGGFKVRAINGEDTSKLKIRKTF